jgi:hypothetical protein
MADQFRHNPPHLPNMPTAMPEELRPWVLSLYRDIERMYRDLAQRSENLITVDVFANRPAADGSYRFYFANDTNALYFDDGTWNAI